MLRMQGYFLGAACDSLPGVIEHNTKMAYWQTLTGRAMIPVPPSYLELWWLDCAISSFRPVYGALSPERSFIVAYKVQ